MIGTIRTRLLAAELLKNLGKITLPAFDFTRVHQLARRTEAAVRQGTFGYTIMIGTRR